VAEDRYGSAAILKMVANTVGQVANTDKIELPLLRKEDNTWWTTSGQPLLQMGQYLVYRWPVQIKQSCYFCGWWRIPGGQMASTDKTELLLLRMMDNIWWTGGQRKANGPLL
jgi:hypothetical protein